MLSEHYKKAVDRVDDDTGAEVLINMGHVYEKLGDPEHARQSLEAAAKLRGQLE